jgi:hypothetical protein
MIQGTWAAAAGTTVINVVGLHQSLVVTLDATITNIQVKVAGEGVLTDLNSNQIIKSISDWQKRQSPQDLTAPYYVIPCADGFIPYKNVQILITKSAAGVAGTVYGFSTRLGSSFFQIVNQTALANSGIDFKKFLFLYVESAGATDKFNLTFNCLDPKTDEPTTFNHQADLPELVTDGTWTQIQKDQVALMIDNTAFRYNKVNVIPSANRSCYFGRFVMDTVDQDLLNSM